MELPNSHSCIINTVKCFQAEINFWVLPTTALVKGCVSVSTVSFPYVDGGGRASASVKLSFSFPAGSCLYMCGWERIAMKHARRRAQCVFCRSDKGALRVLSFCIFLAGEQLSSEVQYQTECITSSATRTQDRELKGK